MFLGLGNDYNGNYGCQFYWSRDVTNPYISIRFLENSSWKSWTKISAGYADSSGSTPSLTYNGYGDGVISAYQTSGAWQTWNSGWASHIICNHGNGSNYYNQTIIMPFWGAPQYMRKEGGTNVGPWTFYTTENVSGINAQFNSLGVGTGGSGTSGEIRATNNITAYYSDDRLKTRFHNIKNALDKVMSLNGFYYEANDIAQTLGYKIRREVGVSAQEVQAILPEIVVPAPIDDKYLTVHYDRLVPLLIEAIKEQQQQIEEQQKQINVLKDMIHG